MWYRPPRGVPPSAPAAAAHRRRSAPGERTWRRQSWHLLCEHPESPQSRAPTLSRRSAWRATLGAAGIPAAPLGRPHSPAGQPGGHAGRSRNPRSAARAPTLSRRSAWRATLGEAYVVVGAIAHLLVGSLA